MKPTVEEFQKSIASLVGNAGELAIAAFCHKQGLNLPDALERSTRASAGMVADGRDLHDMFCRALEATDDE